MKNDNINSDNLNNDSMNNSETKKGDTKSNNTKNGDMKNGSMKNKQIFKNNKKLIGAVICMVSLAATLLVLKQLPDIFPSSAFAHVCYEFRSLVCVSAIFIWMISLYVRITQSQIKRYLITTAFIMIFWMTMRIIKWNFGNVLGLQAEKLMWYLYYVGILYIPVLTLVIAISLGKSEIYKTSFKTKLLFVPTSILFLFVITNDLHRFVFKFPNGFYNATDDYTYGALFYIIIVWVSVVLLWAFAVMINHCRVPYSKTIIYFPFVPFILLMIYAIIYILQVLEIIPEINRIRDMTTVTCIMIMASFKFCIDCGLIPSNSDYGKLFSISSIDAVITDKKYNIIGRSENLSSFPKAIMDSDSVMTPDNKRVSKARLRGGYVIWQEDVSRLVQILEELEDIDEFLQGKVATLQQEYEAEKKHRQLVEQNRIYNIMQNQTAHQMEMISSLTDEFEQTTDKEREKYLLSKTAVICAYLKRRNNLIFLSQNQNRLPSTELSYSIGESMNNLEFAGVNCSFKLQLEDEMPFFVLVELYEIFEMIVELCFDGLSAMFLTIKQEQNRYKLTARVTTESQISNADNNIQIEEEDENTYFISYAINKGAGL